MQCSASGGGSTPAQADSHTVLRVVAVQVEPGKLDSYLAEVAKLNGVMKRLSLPGSVRVWKATYAGPETGAVVVAIEYPGLPAFADGMAKLAAGAEWSKTIAGLDDIRTIVSDSLYQEISP